MELLALGIQPNVSTFTPLIRVLCMEGNVLSATELMKSMEARGLERLVCSNDSIITGFCKVAEPEEGMAWLAKMLENNLKPRVETFTRLVECLSLIGRMDDALLILNAMFEIGYSLGTSVSYLLVNHLCQENWPQARNSLEEIFMTN